MREAGRQAGRLDSQTVCARGVQSSSCVVQIHVFVCCVVVWMQDYLGLLLQAYYNLRSKFTTYVNRCLTQAQVGTTRRSGVCLLLRRPPPWVVSSSCVQRNEFGDSLAIPSLELPCKRETWIPSLHPPIDCVCVCVCVRFVPHIGPPASQEARQPPSHHTQQYYQCIVSGRHLSRRHRGRQPPLRPAQPVAAVCLWHEHARLGERPAGGYVGGGREGNGGVWYVPASRLYLCVLVNTVCAVSV